MKFIVLSLLICKTFATEACLNHVLSMGNRNARLTLVFFPENGLFVTEVE